MMPYLRKLQLPTHKYNHYGNYFHKTINKLKLIMRDVLKETKNIVGTEYHLRKLGVPKDFLVKIVKIRRIGNLLVF